MNATANATLIAELLAEHRSVKATLEKAKDRERKVRDKLVSMIFPDAKKGTNKKSFKELGLEVKAIVKENVSVKESVSDGENEKTLTDLLSENDELVRAFKYKHELVNKEYNSLTDEQKILLVDFVSFKNGAPDLSYEGELNFGYLSNMQTEAGILVFNDVVCSVEDGDRMARYYGFEHAKQLVSFLEEIQ